MITIRKSEDRGHADHGWLRTWHTFSFASYFDPQHTRFRSLRVLNEDWIQGGKGFNTHPHENMEIITYLIEGALEHRDSTGHGSVIRPGELQRMTAGTGINHSEFNPSSSPVHLLQIWIYPERADLEPGYEQKDFSNRWNPNELLLLASQCGRQDSLTIHQDVALFGGRLEKMHAIEYRIGPGRCAWIQLIKGRLSLNQQELNPGDGAAVEDEERLTLDALEDAEFLLFDLA